MNKDNLVVAIILNYNSSSDCRKCLSYLQKQNYSNLKFVIVDNCSRKEDTESLEELKNVYDVKIIYSKENKGYSAGNNIGFRYANSIGAKWCLVINPDVEIRDNNYVRKVIEIIDNLKDVAIVGTNIVLPDGVRQNPMRIRTFSEEFWWPLEIVKHHTKNWDNYVDSNSTGFCNMLQGSCYFISNVFLNQINYLDENVFLYCEEEILAGTIKKNNWKAFYINELTANHEHYEKQKGSRKRRMQIYLNSRWYYFKNYSDFNRAQLMLLKFSLWTWRIYWQLKSE